MSVVQDPQWDTDRVLTIPNLLSFARLASVLVVGVLIVLGHDLAALIVLALFAATDWLDGYLARRLKQTSELGARLDPVADRLFIAVAVISMCIRGLIPVWFLIILLLRDAMLVALYPVLRRLGRQQLPVVMVGKVATFLLMFSFPMILVGGSDEFTMDWLTTVGWVCAGLGAVLYWVAGFTYVNTTRALVAEAQQS